MKKAMQREEVVVAVYVEARVALKDYVSDTKTIVQKIWAKQTTKHTLHRCPLCWASVFVLCVHQAGWPLLFDNGQIVLLVNNTKEKEYKSKIVLIAFAF